MVQNAISSEFGIIFRVFDFLFHRVWNQILMQAVKMDNASHSSVGRSRGSRIGSAVASMQQHGEKIRVEPKPGKRGSKLRQ